MKNILFKCKDLDSHKVQRLLDLAASKGAYNLESCDGTMPENFDFCGVVFTQSNYSTIFLDFFDLATHAVSESDIVTPEEFESYFNNYDSGKKKTSWFRDEEVEILYEDGDQVVIKDKGLMVVNKDQLSYKKPQSVIRNEFYANIHEKWKRQALDTAHDTYTSKYDLQDFYQFLFDTYELKEK